jgi:hypothetical protein
MRSDIREALLGLTVSVEQMGQALGLGRAAAYRAVRTGEVQSIRIGRNIRVPCAPLRRMLGIESLEVR